MARDIIPVFDEHFAIETARLERKVQKSEPEIMGMVPMFDRDWCGREDSNFHGLSATATSRLRVYQFRHDRTP